MLACDMVVAASGARFGIPEVKRGLIAAAGALLELPQRIPPAIATELALTGEPIDAERAAALGLVNRITEPGAALAGAVELAERSPPTRRSRSSPRSGSCGETLDWPADGGLGQAGRDRRPGARPPRTPARERAAFVEKRPPDWQGR